MSGPTPIHVHVRPRLRRIGESLFRDWLATALGNHIWSWRPLSDAELAHEVAHVHQWRRHGAAFPILYLLASLRAWKAGQDWYADNEFERAASAEAS